MSNVILADGLVNGKIIGTDNTKANVSAELSCDGIVPVGSLSGTIQFFDGQFTRNVSFNSNNPFIVATIRTNSLQSVGTVFSNVTVQQNTFTPVPNCTAYLNATRLNSNAWIGSLVIVCPNGLQFFVYGVFAGSTIVNRQVFCKPLL